MYVDYNTVVDVSCLLDYIAFLTHHSANHSYILLFKKGLLFMTSALHNNKACLSSLMHSKYLAQ